MAEQAESTALTINGRFLQHYLRTMEQMQETFDKSGPEGLPAFNKYVFYLRSIINDKSRVDQIDRIMEKERQRIFSRQFEIENPEIDDEQKEFMIGFKVINGCMRYLANTLNLDKLQTRDMSDVNGLMLNHVLTTMEKMQKTFNQPERQGITAFNKYVFYLLSIITDAKKVKEIESEMDELRKKFRKNPSRDDEFLIGFSVISGCMAHIDHTMKINKRQVKVLACQLDPRMPTPTETPLTEEASDNEC